MLALAIKIVTFAFFLSMGLISLALSAVTLRVAIKLLLAGPRAADEAFEAGDSISGWWKGTHPNPTSRGMRGRYVKGLGVVMEETGSRKPTWSD